LAVASSFNVFQAHISPYSRHTYLPVPGTHISLFQVHITPYSRHTYLPIPGTHISLPTEFPFTKLKLYWESRTGKWKLNFIVTEENQVSTVGVVRLWRVCFGEILSETTDRLENSCYIEGLMLISTYLLTYSMEQSPS
jgi:hypothetical protein